MNWKKIVAVVAFVASVAMLSAAETEPQSKEEITKAAMQANKKAVVAHNMILTPEQEKVFWPLYDEYQIEINKLNADREALLMKFSVNFKNLSDELASELTDRAITLEKKRVDVKKSLVAKFGKVLPPKVVARYYQIENKMDAALVEAAAEQIPLVK